ncbi:MAG: hypothetical protein WD200_01665 [Candidatus Andersenbacteria bacterium]
MFDELDEHLGQCGTRLSLDDRDKRQLAQKIEKLSQQQVRHELGSLVVCPIVSLTKDAFTSRFEDGFPLKELLDSVALDNIAKAATAFPDPNDPAAQSTDPYRMGQYGFTTG